MDNCAQSSLITITQAAKQLAVSHATIRRVIREGRLPAYRVGRQSLRVKQTDLESYLQSARVCVA